CSIQAFCTLVSAPPAARPSMVVILRPATALAGIEQERIGEPSTCTVQAPHWAMPQPYLVPVSPTCSRIAHNSGVFGSTSTSCVLPLMFKRTILKSPFCSLGILASNSSLSRGACHAAVQHPPNINAIDIYSRRDVQIPGNSRQFLPPRRPAAVQGPAP